jgi:hypothetical protein
LVARNDFVGRGAVRIYVASGQLQAIAITAAEAILGAIGVCDAGIIFYAQARVGCRVTVVALADVTLTQTIGVGVTLFAASGEADLGGAAKLKLGAVGVDEALVVGDTLLVIGFLAALFICPGTNSRWNAGFAG